MEIVASLVSLPLTLISKHGFLVKIKNSRELLTINLTNFDDLHSFQLFLNHQVSGPVGGSDFTREKMRRFYRFHVERKLEQVTI